MINERLNPRTGDYDGANARTDTLMHAVYVRLLTPLGSWWADPLLGSRLHELKRSKDVPTVRILAQQYAESALAPLLSDGRAKSIDVRIADLPKNPVTGRMGLLIEVVDASDRRRVFEHFIQVGA